MEYLSSLKKKYDAMPPAARRNAKLIGLVAVLGGDGLIGLATYSSYRLRNASASETETPAIQSFATAESANRTARV